MRAIILSLMLVPLSLSGIAAPAASVPSCTFATGSYCADATASVGVSCTLSGSAFTCDLSANHTAHGWTGSAAPGRTLVHSAYLEVGVCDGSNPCTITDSSFGSPCAWGLNGGGCSTSGSWSSTVTGTALGCVVVWVYESFDVRVRAPDVDAINLASSDASAYALYDSCA